MGSESVDDTDVDIVGTIDTGISGSFRPGSTGITTTTTTAGKDETNGSTGGGTGSYEDLFQQDKKPVIVPTEKEDSEQGQQQQEDNGDIVVPDREKDQLAIGRTEPRTKPPEEITFFQGVIEVFNSATPSDMPSLVPSDQPSFVPSEAPSSTLKRQANDLIDFLTSSEVPSDQPSLVPSDQPSMVPSQAPSDLLRQQVTVDLPPTELIVANSAVPSDLPSLVPSDQPSMVPSQAPSSSSFLKQAPDGEACYLMSCISDSDCCTEAPSCRKRDPTNSGSTGSCSTVNTSSNRVSILEGRNGSNRSSRGQAMLRNRH